MLKHIRKMPGFFPERVVDFQSSRLVSKEFTAHQTLFTATPMGQMPEKLVQAKAKISGASVSSKLLKDKYKF